jgi:hypothetical protein
MAIDVLTEANQILDQTLQFYADQGMPLSYTPTIQYHNFKDQTHSDTRASVFTNRASLMEKKLLLKALIKSAQAQNVFGLNLPLEGIKEACDLEYFANQAIRTARTAIQSKDEEPVKHTLHETKPGEINLYKPFSKGPKLLRQIALTHEVEHLVEQERGLSNQPLIEEGVATYVANHRFGITLHLKPGTYRCVDSMLYLGAGVTAQDHLATQPNPYASLFDNSVRDNIQQDFLTRVCQEHTRDLTQFLNANSDRIEQCPRYAIDDTIQRLLDVLRTVELNKLAETLESQDTTRLAQFCLITDTKFFF